MNHFKHEEEKSTCVVRDVAICRRLDFLCRCCMLQGSDGHQNFCGLVVNQNCTAVTEIKVAHPVALGSSVLVQVPGSGIPQTWLVHERH